MNKLPATRDHFQRLIDACSFPGFAFDFNSVAPSVRVRCLDGADNRTGESMSWSGRWWPLSYHMVDGEVVQTLFLAIRVAMEHEVREKFQFKGVAVFDTHVDIHKLAGLRAEPDCLMERARA